jgi:hypothetical protein
MSTRCFRDFFAIGAPMLRAPRPGEWLCKE